jgi:LPXTG-site transpeptidase (sortase) family protein
MRRLLPVVLALLVLALAGCRSKSAEKQAANQAATETPAIPAAAAAAVATPTPGSTPDPIELAPPSRTPTPEPEPPPPVADPVRLRIPKLKVDARIVPVGVNYAGEMDSPKDAWTVAWYAPGYKPTEEGNAVLAGHTDYINVGPAVFYSLKTMAKGDRVFIVAADSKEYEFEVTEIEQCKAAQCPAERIFGPNPNRGLNLITCVGNFNRATLEYDQRIIVYTEEVKPPLPHVPGGPGLN